jgi:hypothetical protein
MEQHSYSQEFSQEYPEVGTSVRQQYAQSRPGLSFAQPQPGPTFAQPQPMQQFGVAMQPVYQVAPMVPVVQVMTAPTSPMASASLALGLLTPVLLFLTLVAGIRASSSPAWLSFVLTDAVSLICALLAIVFGHIALHAIHHSVGRLKGAGLAVIGLVIGYLGLLPAFLFLLVASAIRW